MQYMNTINYKAYYIAISYMATGTENCDCNANKL